MIDTPPLNATPPPPPTKTNFGMVIVPSMWGSNRSRVLDIEKQAERDLNVHLAFLPQGIRFNKNPLAVFELCAQCAGTIVIRDLMLDITPNSANVIDFFFGRDKSEALVYEWQPWEQRFRLVDREWLQFRRRKSEPWWKHI